LQDDPGFERFENVVVEARALVSGDRLDLVFVVGGRLLRHDVTQVRRAIFAQQRVMR
jgi:hypothetical protein